MSAVMIDQGLLKVIAIFLAVVSSSTAVGLVLRLRATGEKQKEIIANLNERNKTWWVLISLFAVSLMVGKLATITLFAVTSLLALREFLSISQTKRADHPCLLAVFWVVLPLQYFFVAMNWFGLFTLFIPVVALLAIPLLSALRGDNREYLSRVARLNWCILLCIYLISYAPAILTLEPAGGYAGSAGAMKLLCFFMLVVQFSDVLQYTVGRLFGRHQLSPSVSPGKTVEGFAGGVLMAGLVGAACHWLTPFDPATAGAIATLMAVLGTGGDLVLSAIKRDQGIKDYSAILPGHGGVLDRVDSICFAAPVFFHICHYLLS
ncbi:MAG: phosphatidate cytidylyltransferase [Candidatus Obscuribacterales bacterium]